MNRLPIVFKAYQQMPCGGAILRVTAKGQVHNGYVTVAHFDSPKAARTGLRAAGFVERDGDWKIRKENP